MSIAGVTKMELLQGEKIIMQDDAKSDFFGKGILYMTNKRILLEVKTGGVPVKNHRGQAR